MTERAFLAVIGSAGRMEDRGRINRSLYDAMYGELLRTMEEWSIRDLVSGGAAFADHLAVRAFLDGRAASLTLHFPAPFQGGAFAGSRGAVSDAAPVANRYHRQFSEACGLNSLAEIATAIRRGAQVHVGRGFKSRNLDVADAATHMLALTFGSDMELSGSGNGCYRDFLPNDPGFSTWQEAGLKDGRGTGHTWSEAWKLNAKRHVNLNLLERCLAAEQAPAVEGPSGHSL